MKVLKKMKETKIRKYILPISMLLATSVLLGSLTGCASDSLGSPCPHYGTRCLKTPINSWNNQNQ